MSEKTVNPYESPSERGAVRDDFQSKKTLTFFVPTIILETVILVFVVVSQVRFKSIFLDAKVDLPPAAQCALHPGFVVFLVFLVLLTAVKEYWIVAGRVKLLANLVMCVTIMILFCMYAEVLTNVIQSLQ